MSEVITIGPHRVRHGDLRDEGAIDELMQGEVADFIYGDPPWGAGNLNYWQTLNKKHTGAVPVKVDYDSFQDLYFKTVFDCTKDVAIIEYGQRWREGIIAMAEGMGFHHIGVTDSTYTSQRMPMDVHMLSKSGNAEMTNEVRACCFNYFGYKLVREMFKILVPKETAIVMDPTCGMGWTARACIENGIAFRGNELNSKRLSKTIARLEKSL